MTKGGRHNQKFGTLKALLFTGSVAATLAGTQLLPLQDAEVTAGPVSTSEPVTVVVPGGESSTFLLPPGDRGRRVELKPIPQAVQPDIKPVARTRSSR